MASAGILEGVMTVQRRNSKLATDKKSTRVLKSAGKRGTVPISVIRRAVRTVSARHGR